MIVILKLMICFNLFYNLKWNIGMFKVNNVLVCKKKLKKIKINLIFFNVIGWLYKN